VPVTTVYLVRHGRTTLNAEGRFRGLQDPPLDDVGLADARAAGSWLRAIALGAVYTSPLERARQTALAIADGRPFAPSVLPGLVDLDHGRWTARTAAEAEEADPEEFSRFRRDPLSSTPPGGEALRAVLDRMTQGIRWLADHHPDAAVAAVSHEIPIRLILASLLDLGGSHMWDLPVPTGSITELRVTPGGTEVATMPFAPPRVA
jgi:broad specificity phosphatase PhoE